MNNKTSNLNKTPNFNMREVIDAVDPTGEKRNKAKEYIISQGYSLSDFDQIEEAFDKISKRIDEILDTNTDEEIDANNGDNEIAKELEHLMPLMDGILCLKALNRMS